MNRNPEVDRSVLSPEAQRLAIIDSAVNGAENALKATGYEVAAEQQAPMTSVDAVMQEAVEFTPVQNQVGGQDGFTLAA